MEERLEDSLREAVEFLEANGFRYAVIGGIALSQWGVIRATRDIDIKVFVPNADYESVRNSLSSAFPIPVHPRAPTNPLIIQTTINKVAIDFLLALPGYEELIIERASRRDLDGWSAWVCSAEDLIIQKAVAGRGKDWSDVEALLIEQRGKLDNQYIKDWLLQFAQVLDNPGIFDQYRRLAERVRKI
ncbi:MAG TPA: nucleotidyltransferase [Anaerolineales bacterium]|nr:nucleotidyltransferase [Anaerolineales bacterium]